jgi:hypothetical protein
LNIAEGPEALRLTVDMVPAARIPVTGECRIGTLEDNKLEIYHLATP